MIYSSLSFFKCVKYWKCSKSCEIKNDKTEITLSLLLMTIIIRKGKILDEYKKMQELHSTSVSEKRLYLVSII